MRMHHVGIAVENVEESIKLMKQLYDVKHISGIVDDENQGARLCMLELEDGFRMELVAGEAVKNIKKKQKLYHVCFETDDLEENLQQMENSGAIMISLPKPAPLFDGRRVAFVATGVGMVELLEKEQGRETEK